MRLRRPSNLVYFGIFNIFVYAIVLFLVFLILSYFFNFHILLCVICRRRKAQERQKKLMADFANKQKEFMEKVINETSGKKIT